MATHTEVIGIAHKNDGNARISDGKAHRINDIVHKSDSFDRQANSLSIPKCLTFTAGLRTGHTHILSNPRKDRVEAPTRSLTD